MKITRWLVAFLFVAVCVFACEAASGNSADLFTWQYLADALTWTPVLLGTVFYTSNNTGTSLATMAPDDIRKLWQTGLEFAEANNDFFADYEGGDKSIVQTVTDLTKGKGQSIRFTVSSGFYDEPHMGEELFETSDDFEEILIDGFDLSVDWLRHGIRHTERMEEVMGMRNEIVGGINKQLGEWWGRLKTEQLFMMFRDQIDSENIVYSGAGTFNGLTSDDTLKWDEVVSMGTQLQRMGGTPAQVGTIANGQPIFRSNIVATNEALFSLKLDPEYKQVAREAGPRGDSNYLLKGDIIDIDGHVIKKYSPIDHDGEGAIGSPLNPKARLGAAITAGTAVIDIKGGGNATSAAKTKKKYFKYFPGYAYRFTPANVLAPASETRYLLIWNPPNAATDPGKFGMYSYTTGNNGNKIAIINRLGSASGTARVTTLGGVTWNTGPWVDLHTDVHPENALIFPCNSLGQIYGDTLMLGRRAAVRGYGKYRMKRAQQEMEGGFVQDNFVVSVFGQAPRRDRLNRVPGVIRLRHAIKYAGVPTPDTAS